MKRKLKGFTLIECIVALAVLAIASLVMADIYANVARMNRNNHLVNTSLSYQMQFVEEYTNSETVPIYAIKDGSNNSVKDTSAVPPHKATTNLNNVKIVSDLDFTSTSDPSFKIKKETYSYTVDIFVLLSRDASNKNSEDTNYRNGVKESDIALRYKYIQGHAN